MMGQLQREEADFCTMASMTAPRLRVMKHAKAYDSDILTLLSLRPKLLPAHLSLIRPFTGELWIALLTSVVVWGVLLWVLQGAWRWFARGHGVTFNTALLYSWGALLEQPPSVPSDNDSGKVLVGWWLVFCLVITTGFRSSLIAHLTVQGKSLPLDTFEDMVGRSNWKWGIETWNLKGVPYDYFTKHTDSVVKKVYQEMEVLDWQEGLLNVQEGGYTFISMVKHLTVIVASHYTDARGQTPFYISQRGVYSLPDYGWGFRKGAPFYTRFSTLMARLGDTGIMSYWIDDVIARHVKKTRDEASEAEKGGQPMTDDSREVVLGLHHLQGSFYLYCSGLQCGSAQLGGGGRCQLSLLVIVMSLLQIFKTG
ncbi:uncharacterized protein LOC121860462, partial [Homarus americanus]|uniref:uncharacterized protein LOC121860462 n=1 Tax=Homarus americanus TaxID=6706 RepID=UPI001C43BBA1